MGRPLPLPTPCCRWNRQQRNMHERGGTNPSHRGPRNLEYATINAIQAARVGLHLAPLGHVDNLGSLLRACSGRSARDAAMSESRAAPPFVYSVVITSRRNRLHLSPPPRSNSQTAALSRLGSAPTEAEWIHTFSTHSCLRVANGARRRHGEQRPRRPRPISCTAAPHYPGRR